MTKFNTQGAGELPTMRQLNRATLLAASAAATILVTTVLPAEYGFDPTGVGGALGLTPMGEMKRTADAASQAASEAEAARALDVAAVPPSATSAQTSEVRLTLQPDQGEEVKATMRAGGEIDYAWLTDGAKVNFELHGEQKGATGDDYTSYEKGTSAGESGKFRAPFDGTHGWYWRNRTSEALTITVKATGTYDTFALVE